jgi:ABC-type nitrate/sulfonate/bicarbonate transport system substrate-binding protein
MIRRILWGIVFALVFWTGPTEAQERLRASWSGASPANAPVWVALEKRLFQKHEVDVEM